MDVGPGTRGRVFLERSLFMVVALLGILKVGAAYIPLDLIYPAVRIASVLDDVGAGDLFTRLSLLEALGPVTPRLPRLDQDWHEMRREG